MGKSKKDEYITELARLSKTKNHELIIEMLDRFNVWGTGDLTEKQVETFLKEVKERRCKK